MKGFIEIHTTDGKKHLVNIRHITEVCGNVVYMDDTPHFATDFSHYKCKERYEAIKESIYQATRDDNDRC